MGREDWYRRTTWTPEDQADFFRRLGRTRSDSYKAQRCRVQALCLEKTGDPERILAAVGLLRLVLKHWPDPQFELAGVHWGLAGCLEKLGRTEEALESLRNSIAAQREFPNMTTSAFLDFGWLVIRQNRTDLFEESIALLREFGLVDLDQGPPTEQYRYAAVCAVVADHTGQMDLARQWARLAVGAAKVATKNSWRYPGWIAPSIPPDAGIHDRLEVLAGDPVSPSE
ncbi:MAG: tetratricopeptide repeat protein [Verrucomicrobiae bacterium]|nr:tetratricopeptide repeat protein [Verrucomicrobiae bacterium]